MAGIWKQPIYDMFIYIYPHFPELDFVERATLLVQLVCLPPIKNNTRG